MLGIHGTKAYLCVVKGYSRQGMSGKERSWFYFPVVLSRFCPVRDLYHDTWFCNIAEYQWFANDRSEKNALTTSNHQNGPWVPVNVASQRNSLVWNITSSISSSKRWMPKSESMSSPMPLCCCLIIHWGLLPFHYRQYAVRFQFLVDEHPPFLRPLGAHHRFSAF